MLHGWGHTLEMLRPLGELLSEHYKVHLLDLPGFGGTAMPAEPWGTVDYAHAILSYMEEKGLQFPFFLGHSFGGKISIHIAASAPGRVKRLVLINSSGLRNIPSRQRQAKMLAIKFLRTVVKNYDSAFKTNLFEEWFIPRFASPDYKNAGRLRQTFVKVVNEDLSEDARKISCPALLLWGAKDTETPVTVGEQLAALISSARLIVLPGKGHVPFLDAGAHLCMYYIKPFLDEA